MTRTREELLADWDYDIELSQTPTTRSHKRKHPVKYDDYGRQIKRRMPTRFTPTQVQDILDLHDAGYKPTAIRNFMRSEYSELQNISANAISSRIKHGPLKPKDVQVITREMLNAYRKTKKTQT